MGNCCVSTPQMDSVNERKTLLCGSKPGASAPGERSDAGSRLKVVRNQVVPLEQRAEQAGTGLKETHRKSARGNAPENANGSSAMFPDGKPGGQERNGGKGASDCPKPGRARRETPAVSHSTAPACQAKKAKKDKEPATSKSVSTEGRGAENRASKEATAPGDTAPKEGERERGGERDVREAKEVGAAETEAGDEGEKMELGSPHPDQGETQREPANQGAPQPMDVKGEPMRGGGGPAEVEEMNSDEDLYRGAEEIEMERGKKGQAPSLTQNTLTEVQDRSSVAVVVDLLSYSQREWRGHTAKSALIRKGYEAVSQSFEGLRRVRGDNYCALRATLFQILAQSTQLPLWLEDDITLWPEKLLSQKDLIGQWRFPLRQREEHTAESAVEQLKHYMILLKTKWHAAASASGAEERQRVCAQVFQGEDEEYALLEALKFLMLRTATELHQRMQRGADVPVFCWLLFARDSSPCPRAFLTNHLNHVGSSGGLEQVEMFLLGYALQQTIKVYRLYKADTEEFITYYPDDHKEDWPCVCLVTEDDRHYNVPVAKRDRLQVPEATTLG
ncbi:OTU deubiquitinase with linear linkage specificity b isoform X1 [Megalops cyprinoides]|uniref:OTU deubiquitinase with linear linkage specificity b isoform X1 n=2 Tax=Megalops cyprinoides TaxID=118141 RepID=UPI001864F345|nr:OTU deubiquitinase with linear linkage specificity b isoform X1 [Megalops cyprinoides]